MFPLGNTLSIQKGARKVSKDIRDKRKISATFTVSMTGWVPPI